MQPNPQPPLPPALRNLLGYALAFALAYIAAKWGIFPAPPVPQPVVVVPTAGAVELRQTGTP